jgi:hypothetical protein
MQSTRWIECGPVCSCDPWGRVARTNHAPRAGLQLRSAAGRYSMQSTRWIGCGPGCSCDPLRAVLKLTYPRLHGFECVKKAIDNRTSCRTPPPPQGEPLKRGDLPPNGAEFHTENQRIPNVFQCFSLQFWPGLSQLPRVLEFKKIKKTKAKKIPLRRCAGVEGRQGNQWK